MKRLCTESEKELLYKNRKQMLKGIFQTASKSGFAPQFVSLFISIILTLVLVIFFTMKLGNQFQVTEFKIKAWIIFLLFAIEVVVSAIMNVFRVKKEAKRFIKRKNIMINGGNIVAVDAADRFAYIEDDVRDEEGRPIIMDYPSCDYDIMPEEVGNRIIILHDGDSGFQLVKVNDELKGLIPNGTQDYPLTEELQNYTRVPHPNMIKIDKVGHDIPENEKDSYADWYVKAVQGEAFKVAKICSFIIVIAIAVICIILSIGEKGCPLWKTLPIGAAGCAGFALFLWLLSRINKVNIKRQVQFTYVKEVIFHSYIFQNNVTKVYVYEWNQGQIQLLEYPAGNVAMKTGYGSVLYKFTDKKGKYVLTNKIPSGKK
ncbi:MAG: hypothetical protein IJA10_03415 [Lachnospiraceae bacterium]|nr:hypothetical protein [Lachnospiraceae bacterium]